MNIKTAIISNDPHCAGTVDALIRNELPDAIRCGIATCIDDAVRLLETSDPQIVFADERLSDGSISDFLRRIPMREFELVFLTEDDGNELGILRYASNHCLLKPVTEPDFEEVLNLIKKRLSLKAPEPDLNLLIENIIQLRTEQNKKISIPTVNGFDFIDLQDILWCRSEGMYTVFHLTDKSRVISSRNIGAYEELLRNNNFFRIHHSVIINMRWIKKYVKGKGGNVFLTDGTELEVSQRRKGEFLDRFLM